MFIYIQGHRVGQGLYSPIILQRGKTLQDFAKTVDKDFAENLKFARVWGANKFDGIRVNKEYVLLSVETFYLEQIRS